MALSPSLASPATTAARSLRSSIRGNVVAVSDLPYETARRLWNGAVDRRPAVIARCEDVRDAVAAVLTARNNDLPLSVRGGGHDWAGRALRESGLVLDLSGMRGVTVDPATGTAEVQGGARTGELVAAAHAYGLAPVAGTVNAVGLTGLTLAGGYGLLNGRHGLALDNLLRAEVVLADGRQVTASAVDNPDLYWAIRGGGGNFGVVTSARYRVHPLRTLRSGLLLFPISEAVDVLRGYRDLIATAPDELTVMTGFFGGPDGAPLLFLLPAWVGDQSGGARMAERLERLGRPISAQFGQTTLRDVLDQFDGSVVDGRSVDVQTRWLPGLTEDTIGLLVGAASRMTSPYSSMFVHHFHGASTRVPATDTAFALRREHLLVEIIAAWVPSGIDNAHRHWARSLSDSLAPYALPGGYPNLLGPDEPDRVRLAYDANLPRLLELKRRYDPDRVFSAVPTLPDA
jgi:FAD/FMN-containing dehydrogenase